MKPERLIWFACIACCLRIGSAQDFQHSYSISPNGKIFIDTVVGNIKIQGYKGDKVEILAYRKGSDGNAIEIQDVSSGDVISLTARPRLSSSDQSKVPQPKFPPGGFPQGKLPPGGFGPGSRPDAGRIGPGRFDVGNNSVDFEIRVPKTSNYSSWVRSFKGNLEVSNVSGQLRVSSAHGNMDIKDVHGFIRCEAFNGSVQVELGSHKDANDLKFSSINGDVVVKAHGNLDAEIFMSSESGGIKTDYSIPVQENRYGHGRFAQAKLGSGRQKLMITSVSGSVNLLKK
jgi:hypothetical protein